jgi:hypothetical protein
MSGPFLYDDDPAPLHTGSPRGYQGWLIGGVVAVALLAGGMVGALYLVKGSPAEQATEATGVFLAALANGDTETAHQLLCEEERDRLEPEAVEDEYLRSRTSEIVGVGDSAAGARVQQVIVRWDDGDTARLAVVNEDGPRICGIG